MRVMLVARFVEDTPQRFRHRVQALVHSAEGKRLQVNGAWTGYDNPATLRIGEVTYVCVNQNYLGSREFPNPDRIYEIREHAGALYETSVEKFSEDCTVIDLGARGNGDFKDQEVKHG